MEVRTLREKVRAWFKNLAGRLTGDEPCMFCGDRANWKPMMGNISVSAKDKKVEYDLPMCEDCFSSRPLNEILHQVNAGISKHNNFCRSFGAEPDYSNDDEKLIMDAVEALKSVSLKTAPRQET